jgi:hypothetical protein
MVPLVLLPSHALKAYRRAKQSEAASERPTLQDQLLALTAMFCAVPPQRLVQTQPQPVPGKQHPVLRQPAGPWAAHNSASQQTAGMVALGHMVPTLPAGQLPAALQCPRPAGL